MKKIFSTFILLQFCIFKIIAQVDTLKIYEIEAVEIRASRISVPKLQQPFSVSVYLKKPIQETFQQLSLQEYLTQIPGLFSLNANNYAQDLRISIRGFGARSAFGIRGVKIVTDGIPETTPDGQGQIDNLNLGIIQRIEVLKGPSSALYGNASGGVINIFSEEKVAQNYAEVGLTSGSFGLMQYQLKSGFRRKGGKLIFQGTHTETDGFREQNRLQNTNLNLRFFQKISARSKFNLQANYTNSPIGDDPGGLILAEAENDPSQARERNIEYKTGESIDQFKTGGRYQLQIDSSQNIEFYAFYSRRNFEGLLPFTFGGWVDLQRNYFGQGGHYKLKNRFSNLKNTLQVGYETAFQNDRRQRYRNELGTQGDLTLDQDENFTNLGIYALNHLKYQKLLITAGLRFDNNRLKVIDQKTDDGDQSDEQNLPAFNYSLGANYEAAPNLHFYGNYRSSFETPALSELSANPSGEAGFNPDLDSQLADNFEVGLKGLLFQKIDFDAAVFYIKTNDDLVSYELPDFPGRSFFRNAGTSVRRGVELSAGYRINAQFSLRAAYTGSDFKYEKYQLSSGDFGGKTLPGIPQNFGSVQLNYESENGLRLRLQHRYVGKIYTSDSNEFFAPDYHLTDLNLGYSFQKDQFRFVPFFGVNNIFDTQYNDNIRINAFGGRHYEPAPGINFYGGLRCRFSGRKKK